MFHFLNEQKNRQALWMGGILIIALIARLLPGPRTVDDAFITFRYARNVLGGQGFVYNPHEHVLGTTTPLYALLMAVLGLFAGGVQAPFPSLALVFNALADVGTCALLIWIGNRVHHPRVGLLTALAWSIAPWSVTFAIGGLETSWYVFLLTAMAAAYLAQGYGLTVLCAALAMLTRPDALLLVLLLAGDALWRIRQHGVTRLSPRDVSLAAVGGVLLLTWGGVSFWFYGSPIPHSLIAKQAAYHLKAYEALLRLLQHYATPFQVHARLGMWWVALGMLLYPFLSVVGIRSLPARDSALRPWLVFPWVYFAAFAVANPLIFRWYLTPPLPPYFFGILLGGKTLFSRLTAYLNRGRAYRCAKYAGITLALLISFGAPLSTWVWQPSHGLNRPAPDMAWYELELLYHKAARILLEQPPLGHPPLLAAADVGVLGYDTNWRILDLVGLNSPQSTSYYPLPDEMYIINYAVPPDLVLQSAPEYLVLLEVYGRYSLLRNPQFKAQYVLLRRLDTDIYGSDGMLIFARRTP